MMAEKIALTGEKETLLITLYAKAEESRLPDSLLRDVFAAEAVRRIDYDFAKLKVTSGIVVSTAMRSKLLDDWTREFINRNPVSTVLHLGCGLDSRIFRLDPPPGIHWFDVDYPDVIALRRRLYPARDGYALIAASVTDPNWPSAVPGDRPVLIIAEGLMPYLREEEVPRLFARLTDHFASGEVIFDGYSRLGLRLLRITPAIKATGATVHWSIDDPRELVDRVPKLKFVAEAATYDRARIAKMSWMVRLTIRLLEAVPAFRRMGRFLRYRF